MFRTNIRGKGYQSMKHHELNSTIRTLVNNKSVASNLQEIVSLYKNTIIESDIDSSTDPMGSNQVLNNFKRRKKSLTLNNKIFYGLDETLKELENLDANIILIHSNNKKYNLTLFLNTPMTKIIGVVVIEN